MSNKLCKKCLETKNISFFYKDKQSKDLLSFYCKPCKNKRDLSYRKKNIKKIQARDRKYHLDNKEIRNKQRTNLYKKNYIITRKPKQFNTYKEYYKQYYSKNKDKIIKKVILYSKKKRKTDVNYNLSLILRGRFNKALKYNYKSGSAIKDLGCSIPQFKKYIEAQFQPGMTWDNYGRSGWHIDHIIPISKFNLSDRNELIKAVNYKNLQPLWAKDNCSKGNRCG